MIVEINTWTLDCFCSAPSPALVLSGLYLSILSQPTSSAKEPHQFCASSWLHSTSSSNNAMCPEKKPEMYEFLKYLLTFFFYVFFSHSVLCKSLWYHRLPHTRLLGPSPSLGVCSNSCPLSRWKVKVKMLVAQSCPTVLQAPLSMGFSRQQYWSGWLFPFPADFPDPEMEFQSLALQMDSLPSKPPRKSPVISSKHLMLCCPLWFLPSISASIKIFSSELALRIR